MASELRVNTLKDASGNNSIATSYVANGSAKAWVYTADTGSVRDSFNVASFTDHGTGDWQYNLTNSMSASTFPAPSTAGSFGFREVIDYAFRKSTTVMASSVGNAAGTSQLDNAVSQVAHGDLA